MNYSLPDFGYNKFRQDIADISRKAARLGLDPVVVTEIRRTCTEYNIEDADGPQYYTTVEFSIEGEIPVVNGWTFIGSVEAKQEGNVFHPFPGFEIPERFRNRFICDHCGTQRYRKLTYILKNDNEDDLEVGNESGMSYIQVGSTCLRDFTRETRINRILAYYENIRARLDLIGSDDPVRGYRQYGSTFMFSTVEYLTRVAYAVRTEGWISRSAADSDPSKVATIDNMCHISHGDPEDLQMAKNALGRVRGLDPEDFPEGGYMRNLYYACVDDYFNPRYSRGIVASLIAAYIKFLTPDDAVNSEWVGAVGEKLTIPLVRKQSRAV
jgi:hypothetical protein